METIQERRAKEEPLTVTDESGTRSVLPGTRVVSETRLKRRALSAVLAWARDLDAGCPKRMSEYARRAGISRAQFRTALAEPDTQKAIFGDTLDEARAGVRRGVTIAARVIDDPDVNLRDKRYWIELLMKFSGGQFERRDSGPSIVIANIIPELPHEFRRAESKVIDLKKGLGDLVKE